MKDLKRWIELRDGKAPPASEEELLELMAFEIKNHCAMEEQAFAQRRPPSPDEMKKRRLATARKLMEMALSGFEDGEDDR